MLLKQIKFENDWCMYQSDNIHIYKFSVTSYIFTIERKRLNVVSNLRPVRLWATRGTSEQKKTSFTATDKLI